MRELERQLYLARRRCQQWNAIVPVGTVVRYYPIFTDVESFKITKTSGCAWALAHGAAIVKIDGQDGGVSLDALEIVEACE